MIVSLIDMLAPFFFSYPNNSRVSCHLLPPFTFRFLLLLLLFLFLLCLCRFYRGSFYCLVARSPHSFVYNMQRRFFTSEIIVTLFRVSSLLSLFHFSSYTFLSFLITLARCQFFLSFSFHSIPVLTSSSFYLKYTHFCISHCSTILLNFRSISFALLPFLLAFSLLCCNFAIFTIPIRVPSFFCIFMFSANFSPSYRYPSTHHLTFSNLS